MMTFEEFRQQLQHALLHLNDPNYVISSDLCQFVLCAEIQQPCLSAFQSTVINAIQAQKPASESAPGSRSGLIYKILEQRFIMGQTQEQVAEQLNLSIRSLQRLQREATHILARYLWNRCFPSEIHSGPDSEQLSNSEFEPDWSAQLKHELLLLQNQSPHAECVLDEVIEGALHLVQATERTSIGIAVPIKFSKELFQAVVEFHPTVLQQVFVDLLSELLRKKEIEQVHIKGQIFSNQFQVLIIAVPITGQASFLVPLASELLASQAGSINVRHEGDSLTIQVNLPLAKSSQPIPILVVDDNSDLVSLYQSYCTGTPFQLYHVREGKQVIAEIQSRRPEIIMLDILLPDINGLDLLLNLHTHPETKSIPVIVCSVIADEQLVQDLGAALYLRKPVWKQQMLSSFETVLKYSKNRPFVIPG